MIAIQEENTPALHQLATRANVHPSRQFACEAEPGRIYVANFAAYTPGVMAELRRPEDHEINHAIHQMAAIIHDGGLGRLEPPDSGNPGRALEITANRHRHLLANVFVVTTDEAALHTPTEPELHQLFSFLARCHPLG